MTSITEKYTKEVVPAMKKQYGYTNLLQVPRLTKVTLNVGVGRSLKDADFLTVVENTLTNISGQKPVRTKAKKSIAGFKLRQGQVVGMTVTIRDKRMYDFLEKLLNVTFPRIRDFRGITIESVDDHGNLAVGFKENLPFPEVRSDEIERIHGLEVSIATTAKTKEEGQALFKLLGFPFKQ